MKTLLNGLGYCLAAALLIMSCDKDDDISTAPTKDTIPPTVEITSPENGAIVSGTIDIVVAVYDNKGVTKVEMLKNGTVSATDESSPFGFTWDTDAAATGIHILQARAYDAAGNVGTSNTVSVTVAEPLDVIFHNTVFTDISITIGSVTETIPVNDSITFTFAANPGTFSYTATTSGKTTGGTVVGKVINWAGNNIDVAGMTEKRINLVVSPQSFFIYVTNQGSHTLNPFYVNYGLTSQTMDNIVIPPDHVKYRIGYYSAYSNTQVRAYWQGTTTYAYWDQGTHFILSGTNNQYVNLLNTSLLAPGIDPNRKISSAPGELLLRAKGRSSVRIPAGEIHLDLPRFGE
ncbi:MAG: Ig-like domain-containing protein [Bacteroidota bacterium]